MMVVVASLVLPHGYHHLVVLSSTQPVGSVVGSRVVGDRCPLSPRRGPTLAPPFTQVRPLLVANVRNIFGVMLAPHALPGLSQNLLVLVATCGVQHA